MRAGKCMNMYAGGEMSKRCVVFKLMHLMLAIIICEYEASYAPTEHHTLARHRILTACCKINECLSSMISSADFPLDGNSAD